MHDQSTPEAVSSRPSSRKRSSANAASTNFAGVFANSAALERRAIAALYRSTPNKALWDQPNKHLSGVEVHKGLAYVVLRNIRGILAVYQIHSDGRLKRLDAWPSAIKAEI